MSITEIIILCMATVLFTVMGIILLHGKGAFIIAGYNTMSREAKKKFDEKALCRFAGLIVLTIPFFLIIAVIGLHYIGAWFSNSIVVFSMICFISAVVYANTGKRFQRDVSPKALLNVIGEDNETLTPK